MTEPLEQNQRVIEDFTAHTLSAIPTDLAKLIYIAQLRDLGSGRYHHAGLAAHYSGEAVNQALALCHGEVFLRVLESPLGAQARDLRAVLASIEGEPEEIAARWLEMEFYGALAPLDVPKYLRDLFASNLRILLQLFIRQP